MRGPGRNGSAGAYIAPALWGLGVVLAVWCLLDLREGRRFEALYVALGAALALKVASDAGRPGGLT